MTDYHEDNSKENDIDNAKEIIEYACSQKMHDSAIEVCNIFNKKWKHRTDIFEEWRKQIMASKNKNGYIFGLFENEDGNLIYVSKKSTWEENQCCDDWMEDDIYDLLSKNDIHSLQDGVFQYDKEENLDKLKDIMLLLGFEYCEEFEEFMIDGEE